ncbi:MAG: response regulator transcription factor [Oscillospiraceae bacterium]|jgi:two-component system response regulator VicR|nr:response regulator transcription factor [Oscillospiraceae bacterium]
MAKILIVDDEPAIVDILRYNLVKAGYGVVQAYDGKQALEIAQSEAPDCVLLDVMLPVLNGFEVCRELRRRDRLVPILMLTAREEERDRVFGLDLGADDYIIKPFSVKEVLARVKSNLRRGGVLEEIRPAEQEVLTIGRLTLETSAQRLLKDGVTIEISQREFGLLRFMAKGPANTVYSRDQLMSEVWGYGYVGDARIVDVAVRRLREKLEDDPANPTILLTKRGAGYYINS